MKTFLIRIFFLSTLLLAGKAGYSQIELPKVIPPAPDVAALMRYAEIPVDYSTGVPDISIPIYTVKTGKLSLPVSLSYHASGIKVRDIASVVGLGWSLNAGGAVARTVLGRRDESLDYISPYKTTDDLQTARNSVTNDMDAINLIYHYQNINKERFETQSDRYAYNFNGKSGVFRFDWITGNVRLIPYAPLKISREYVNNVVSPLNLYYVITDEEGTKYFFESTEVTTQSGSAPTTAWNLTKVVSVDKKDEIKLYYSGGELFVQVSESVTLSKSPFIAGANPSIPSQTNFSRTPIGSQYSPKRLDSIVTKDCVVKFIYSGDRQDGRQMRLTNITVGNKSSDILLRQANLAHSYFGTVSDHTLRLRMDNVQIQGDGETAPEKYSFTYNNNVPPGYYLTNGYVFPGGSSFPANIAEDYWGYSGGGGGIPSEYLGFLNSSELSVYGGNKNPSIYSAQDCIIQQIKYPSGGNTVFEFESNRTDNPRFYNYGGQLNANGGIVGGLRIKSIKNYTDDNILSSQKSYTYDAIGSEQTISSVLFSYKQPIEYINSTVHQGGGYGGTGIIGVFESDIAVSTSSYPLSVMNSASVVYSQVSEYQGSSGENVGKTIFTYKIPPGTTLQSSNLLGSPKFLNGFTLDRGSSNPLLETKTVYKNTGGSYAPVNKLENSYSYQRTNEFLTGVRVDQEVQFRDVSGYYSPDTYDTPYLWDYLNSYTWEATKGYEDVALLDSVITTDFSGTTAPVIQKTSFKYENLDHLLPTQKEVSDSEGGRRITQYRYPHDFIGQQPYTNLVNNYHNWSEVVEKTDYSNTTGSSDLINAVKTNFTDWGNDIISPISVETKAKGENYETRLLFQGYFSKEKIKSFSKYGGSKTIYLYSYNKQHPIAEIRNTDYSSVENILSAAAIEEFSNRANPDKAAVDAFLAPLKANLPHIYMTSYTYRPLVGMTSQTDVKGMTTYYEYDSLGRLLRIKDQNQHMIKSNTYHYKN